MLKRTLFFSKKHALTTQYEQLVIKGNTRQTTVPIEDIGFIVIENQETYISLPALTKLSANNVIRAFLK